jgi:tRNASer (uridine44-2'-O)-methyltransferase
MSVDGLFFLQDIGIATYLMLLWKVTFKDSPKSRITPDAQQSEEGLNSECPWRSWPRPPGGFVDLG